MVFCNRTGIEDDATYAGTSAVIGIQEGEVKVYGLLGRGEKELLITDTDKPPYAKMIYRPEAEGSYQSSDPQETVNKSRVSSSSHHQATFEKVENFTSGLQRTNRVLPSSADQLNGGEGQSASIADSKESGHSRPSLPGKSSPNPLMHTDGKSPSLAGELKKLGKMSISIPSPRENNQDRSASPSGKDCFNVPTPSAPSPTPMALRPKLVIPQSLNNIYHDQSSVHLISAASEGSEQSLRSLSSFRSSESAESNHTVRGGPRPPEDSTPYPDSAVQGAYGREIFGGDVTIFQEEPLSATTPFSDLSPVSTRIPWRPLESSIRTPISAEGWTPGPSKASTRPSNTESNGRQVRTASETIATSRHTPDRPSSPKSRNASRPRMGERPDGPLTQRDISTTAIQIESISTRAESADESVMPFQNSMKRLNLHQSPDLTHMDRKFLGLDFSMSGDEKHTIPIAASPSILNQGDSPEPDSKISRGPLSKVARHQSYSPSPKGVVGGGPSENSLARGNVPRPASRSTNRSRSRNASSSFSGAQPSFNRSRSLESSRNEAPGPANPTNPLQRHELYGPHRPSRSHRQMRYERVEAIISPDCPIHRQRPVSPTTSHDCSRPSSPDSSPGKNHKVDHQIPQMSASGRTQEQQITFTEQQSESREHDGSREQGHELSGRRRTTIARAHAAETVSEDIPVSHAMSQKVSPPPPPLLSAEQRPRQLWLVTILSLLDWFLGQFWSRYVSVPILCQAKRVSFSVQGVAHTRNKQIHLLALHG